MLLTLVTFFIVLGVLVLVHEIGHFVMARRYGVKVEEFGLGIPPRFIGFYKNKDGKWTKANRKQEADNVIWSLNWLPLGGFVKIKGEQGESADDEDSFASKSVPKRLIIISAGVIMNVFLAMFLMTIGYMVGFPQFLDGEPLPKHARVSDSSIMVLEVLPESPAGEIGLLPGDQMIAVDNNNFTEIAEFQNYIDQNTGVPVSLTYQHNNEIKNVEITPEILEETEKGGVGVALAKTGFVSYPWYVAWWFGITETLKLVVGVIVGFFIVIKQLLVSGELMGEVYGPVGIAGLIGNAARLGFLHVIQFTAILSVIIAVVNFLPFPALDGGRAVFFVIEAIRGKPADPKFEAMMHNIGFILLMLLILLITVHDISRVSTGFVAWWQGLF